MKSVSLVVGTERHKSILQALEARYIMSSNEMTKRFETWQRSDDEYTAYVDVSEADTLRKASKTSGDPQYLTLNIPYSYAMLMTAHTYWTSIFLSRDPVLQFAGRHGESEMNVKAVEAVMAYQTVTGGHMAPYYVWLHDAGRYGLGILWNYWEKETHYVSQYEERTTDIAGVPGAIREVKKTQAIPGYEGTKVFNVRPYDYLPDTRVPLTNPQLGEFVGRKLVFHWNDIVRRKLTGQYIEENIPEVRKAMVNKALRERENFRNTLPDSSVSSTYSDSSLVSGVDGYEMVVEIIPKDWMLGSTEYPEKWVFSVVDRKIILEARPLGLYHNKFPVAALEIEMEGYTLHKRGMLDIGRPLNDTLNWLINTHYYNVRKSLEGEIIFDPSRVVAKDLLDPKPGKRIRLRPMAYGQDVRTMISTIHGTADVTKGSLQDSVQIEQMLQRILGVSDGTMGMTSPGSRKTATEVRASAAGSINRMKTVSEYMSHSGFAPNAQMLLASTQQLYKAEKVYKLAGDQMYNNSGLIDVNAEVIAGAYDFVAVDGTLPIDRFAMVNMWTQLLAQLRAFPQIMQEHDMGKIFEWVATLGGMKNIRQFRVNQLDQNEISKQVQRGNLVGVPQNGQNGPGGPGGQAPPGRPTQPSMGGSPVLPVPRQIPGMGPSG